MSATPSTRNITKIFRQTTTDDRIAGLSWYATAREVATQLDPADPARAAAVLAVLSPRTSWPLNVRLAQDAYAGRKVGALGANVRKVQRILSGEDPADVVTGDKVRAFWLTIVDPSDARAVVVDRHAFDVACDRVTDDKTRGAYLGRVGKYAELADLYRRAAKIISRETGQTWTPAAVQATTWVYWRRERAVVNHG